MKQWDPKNTLEQLYPPFAMQVETWLDRVWGLPTISQKPYIWCGYRSVAEQNALYAIGRRGIAGEKIVTRARGGYSIHQYGMAVDIVADANSGRVGLQPLWAQAQWYSDLFGEAAVIGLVSFEPGVGLEWSGNWKSFAETCHYQNRFGMTIAEMMLVAEVSDSLVRTYSRLDELIAMKHAT